MDVKAGALVVQYMRGGERVTKEDYEKNRKVKNAKNKSMGDDHHKIENSNEILLQKKIADLEKALRDKEKQNTTLQENFQNKLKENKDFQLKLEKANGLNEELLKKIDQKDMKIETLEKQMESKMRHTKSSFKKKIKELREAHKDKLSSKDVTIAKLSQKLTDKEQTSVRERKVKSLNNLHHKTPLDGKKETNREITRLKNQSSIPVCELHDNARLNSLETAVHLLKKQLCTQNNELAQLRNVCISLNNAGKSKLLLF